MAASASVIATAGLEKDYGATRAVRSLDLDVRQGEIFGLLGPNGAGKTTTILMLLGLAEPTAGSARVLGLDPTHEPLRVKRQVGYVPDNVGFYGNLTARENLRYTCRLNRMSTARASTSIERWLGRVGLTDVGDDRVDRYSRGMRQRLGLADALVKDPAVLILDEPTASIDPIGVRDILDLVDELAREDGVTVLLSSHLLDQVQRICDRIAIFVAGEVVAMGTVADLARQHGENATVGVDVGLVGDAGVIQAVLTSVNEIVSVRPDPSDRRIWSVTGHEGVVEALLRALLDAGLTPWSLKHRGTDLDDIYRGYFTHEPALAPADVVASTAGVSS